MQQRKQIALAVAMAISSMAAFAQTAEQPAVQSADQTAETAAQPAAAPQKVEVTGSRIKRASAEGALPVTVVTRAQLEDSGAVTIAEFVRNSTFSSTGQFRPQSGSSAQSFSGVNLRGLGERRTLVLVDGRRVAKAPNVGDAVDMNSIPMAAVERIEILTDGASAVYGSEAIGGVINIILRKDFDGVYLSGGKTYTNIKGGDREEASAMIGMSSEKGRLVAGVSKTQRDIIFVRDYPWGAAKGASAYSNRWYRATSDGAGGYYPSAWIGNAGSCDFPDKGFYVRSNGQCAYDFNLVAADEAATGTKSVYLRGEYNISDDWTVYMGASNTNNTSFGRYAPVPDAILVGANTVGNTSPTPDQPVYLLHRFAAAGNRDTSTDGNLTDMSIGLQGTAFGVDWDGGVRRTSSKLVETGRGFIVKGLATTAINNGTYNVENPFANSDAVLKSITTTTGRDSLFSQSEVYLTGTTELFQMAGGASSVYAGAEYRHETYADVYDSLSEAGEVLGSSGNSAGGSRKVGAGSLEWLLPFTKTLEGTIAARYEKYSDYGSDFSPKASMRWSPTRSLVVRGSVGRGFAAPTLPMVTQKPAYSADSVIDVRHCEAQGGYTPAECETEAFQINGLHIANPELGSEKSKQFSFGAAWDATQQLTVKADYWNTQITDVISFVGAQSIVNRDNGTDARAIPAGLSIRRDPTTGAIIQVISGYTNEGVLKFAGIDAGAVFTHSYSMLGKFRHDLTWSHVNKRDSNGVDYNGDFGAPKNRAVLANTWSLGDFDAAYNVNLIGKSGEQDSGLYVGSYVTHDLQFSYKPAFLKGFKLTLGVVNAGGKLPALVSDDSRPFNYALYDAYGRQGYFRLEQRF